MFFGGYFPPGYLPPGYFPQTGSGAVPVVPTGRGKTAAGRHYRLIQAMIAREYGRELLDADARRRQAARLREGALLRAQVTRLKFAAEQYHVQQVRAAAAYTLVLSEI